MEVPVQAAPTAAETQAAEAPALGAPAQTSDPKTGAIAPSDTERAPEVRAVPATLPKLVMFLIEHPESRDSFLADPVEFLRANGLDVTDVRVAQGLDRAELDHRLAALARGEAVLSSPAAPATMPVIGAEAARLVRPAAPPVATRAIATRFASDHPSFPMSNFGPAEETAEIPRGLALPEFAGRPTEEAARLVRARPQTDLRGAWFASGKPRVLMSAVGPQAESGMVAEAVMGQDDRVQVRAPGGLPYRWMCRLEITARDGTLWLGTGWLAAPNLVITAGHCVFLQNHGGWASSVLLQSAADPQSAFVSNRVAAAAGWVTSGLTEYDYGAIFLNGELPASTFGYFGFGAFPDTALTRATVNVTGFPLDKPSGTLWGHSTQLLSVRRQTLLYTNDTFGGMSGAPVILWDGNDYAVIGIHNYGDIAGNVATRIDAETFENIIRWRDMSV